MRLQKLFEYGKLDTTTPPKVDQGPYPDAFKTAMLAGDDSLGWDSKMEAQAKWMEKRGYGRDEVWEYTGMVRRANGKWAYEIPNNKAKIKKIDWEEGKDYKFSEIVDHKELYDAYPFLKDYTIRIEAMDSGALGEWNHTDKIITLDPGSVDRFTVVHELQHVIDSTAKDDGHDTKYTGTDASIEHDVGWQNEYTKYAAYHVEMDARTVEKRMDYTDWERKHNVPTNRDSQYITIQDKPISGINYPGLQISHNNAKSQEKYNPLKTVGNPHYDGRRHKDATGVPHDWKNPYRLDNVMHSRTGDVSSDIMQFANDGANDWKQSGPGKTRTLVGKGNQEFDALGAKNKDINSHTRGKDTAKFGPNRSLADGPDLTKWKKPAEKPPETNAVAPVKNKKVKTTPKQTTVESTAMNEIYKLRYLSGITDRDGYKVEEDSEGSNISITGSERGRQQREKNIQPGTDEWFQLWFSKPHLTGEKPTGK